MAFTLLIAGDFFQLRYFDIRYKVNQVGMISDKIINTGMIRNTGYQNNSTCYYTRYRHKHLISLSRMCHKSQCVIGTGFPAIVLLSGCCCIEGRGGIIFLL